MILPSGLADTPADHTLVAASMRSIVPSVRLTVIPLRSTSVTIALSWISTPSFSSRSCGLLAELLAHRRQHRGCGVEQDHPGPGGVDVAERAAQGVIGEFGDLPGHLDTGRAGADHDEGQQLLRGAPGRWTARPARMRRGCGHATPARRRWSSCRAPTRRTGRCRSTTARRPRRRSGCRTGSGRCGPAGSSRRSCCARSILVTSPSSTWQFSWLRRITRVGGAISPSEMMPVATWYSSGWNRWWVVLAMSLMSTSARLSFCAAFRPPNPEPMMTTLCLSDGVAPGWVISAPQSMHRTLTTLVARPTDFASVPGPIR